MIFNAIRNIFVKNKRKVNMTILQRLCLEERQWLAPNSQYSASRKMYFLFPPPQKIKNLWLHQFSHDTYGAMFRFLAME